MKFQVDLPCLSNSTALQILEIRRYGPVYDVSETGLLEPTNNYWVPTPFHMHFARTFPGQNAYFPGHTVICGKKILP